MVNFSSSTSSHWHFDFDGTLFFTLDALCTAYRLSVTNYSGIWTPAAETSLRLGNGHLDFLPLCIWNEKSPDFNDVRNLKNSIYLDNIGNIKPNTELLEFVTTLPKKSSIVTSANRIAIVKILEHFNYDSLFASIVASEDVKENKPSPEPYLKSIQMNPATLHIAVEDSEIGVRSALKAGMTVFQFRTNN